MEYCDLIELLKNNEGDHFGTECFVEINDGTHIRWGRIVGINTRYERNNRITTLEQTMNECERYKRSFGEYRSVVVLGQDPDQYNDRYYL
ncbi:MAG: hypothetical protein ACOH15_05020 [Acetobacterium sp.]